MLLKSMRNSCGEMLDGFSSGRKTGPDLRRWCSSTQFTGTVFEKYAICCILNGTQSGNSRTSEELQSMRAPLNLILILGLATGAKATIINFTFSGTFASTCPSGSPTICVTSLGLVHDGDTFSGTAAWDDSTIGATIPNVATTTSLLFTGPAGEGMSGNQGAANITFAGATYSGSSFNFLQINVRSTVDSNFYIFFLGSSLGVKCNGAAPLCLGEVSNTSGTAAVFAKSYTEAVSAVPEPSTAGVTMVGLGFFFTLLKCVAQTRVQSAPRLLP